MSEVVKKQNTEEDDDGLVKYCSLCNTTSGPAFHSGCSRSEEKGCAWNHKEELKQINR